MFQDVAALKEAGFAGFWTVRQLRHIGLIAVPNEMGVYLALWTDEYYEFLENSRALPVNGRDPSVSVDTLYDKWVHDSVVIYIGKAGGPTQKATLRSRIAQFVQFGNGASVPHWGGRYVWQIADSDSVGICWHTSFDCEPQLAERLLITRFKGENRGMRPFANLRG